VAPYAYLVPVEKSELVQSLQEQDIEVHVLREDITVEVQVRNPAVKRGRDTNRAGRNGRGNQRRRVRAGTWVVYTDQPHGDRAVALLQVGSGEVRGQDPVGRRKILRLGKPQWLLTTKAIPPEKSPDHRRRLSFDDVYGGDPINLSGSPTAVLRWFPDEQHYLQLREGRLAKVHAKNGRASSFFDAEKLAAALEANPFIDADTARSVSRRTRFHFNSKLTGALLNHDNDLYFFRFDGSIVTRLTHTPEIEELTSFSPDGEFVAFVRESNLYVIDLATQTERALTSDGNGVIRNGKADWIYFEELFARSWRAYWWSPDSRRLAFLRFDASALPMFSALDTLPLHGALESMRHPKVSDPNPDVRLGVVTVSGGPVRWADLTAYTAGSYLIAEVGWYPDGRRVFCYVQNRIQTWLDFLVWTPRQDPPKRLFRDSTKAWIMSPGPPHFLADGTFLMLSDRTGWNHLYLFNPKTEQWKPVTSGDWEIRQVHHFAADAGWVYFTATRDSSIGENLYRCRPDGSKLRRISRIAGHHRIGFSPGGGAYVDTWSSYHEPTQVALYRSNGREIRRLDANPVPNVDEFDLGKSRLMQIVSRDGFIFEAAITTPPGFDSERQYPVWFMTYGGPDAPSIRDAWQGGHLRDQLLASMGLIVFRMDPRSASGKGSCSAWTAYRQLGVQELKDITEAVEWLKRKACVDPTRIGMSGHSYGGFMTAYAMTHSGLFAAGIAGAPVTDWRYYDSIYTERYMDLPEHNPDGYALSSVVEAAANLRGELLLLHGMMDDNVHLQNSTQLINAFQKANVDFRMMFYPTMKHGLYGDHYHRLVIDFIRDSLRLDVAPASP